MLLRFIRRPFSSKVRCNIQHILVALDDIHHIHQPRVSVQYQSCKISNVIYHAMTSYYIPPHFSSKRIPIFFAYLSLECSLPPLECIYHRKTHRCSSCTCYSKTLVNTIASSLQSAGERYIVEDYLLRVYLLSNTYR